MDTKVRNLLLMEKDGFDCSEQAKSLGGILSRSALYTSALDRLNRAAQNALTKRVVNSYTALRDMNFDCSSIEEYVEKEALVARLAVFSLPQWWVNPLNPFKGARGAMNSVGQLFADDDGHTFDSVITDPDLCDAERLNIVAKRVDLYHREMAEYADGILARYRATKSYRGGGKGIAFYLEIVLMILASVFIFLVLMIPSSRVQSAFFHPRVDLFQTWAIFLPLGTTIFYDLMFVIYTCITLNRNRASDYAAKFADKRSKRYMEHLDEATALLLDDLVHAIHEHSPLANDISKYSSILGADLDIDSLVDEQKRRDRKPLTLLKAVFFFSTYLCLFTCLFSLIVFLLMFFGGGII